MFCWVGFGFVVSPPLPNTCVMWWFPALYVALCCCLVLTVSFSVFLWLGHGVGHPPYLASRLKKVYSYTSTPSLCLHGKLQGELCLSRGIWLDTVSSLQFLSWQCVTDSSSHVWLWLSVSSLLCLSSFWLASGLWCALSSWGLTVCCTFSFWYLDVRTRCINIIIEYLGH